MPLLGGVCAAVACSLWQRGFMSKAGPVRTYSAGRLLRWWALRSPTSCMALAFVGRRLRLGGDDKSSLSRRIWGVMRQCLVACRV
eukprot:350956-Prymnesium_polylepis.1